MVIKEYLAVSGCFPRASHSFLSMFFQNISIALVKYLDVFEKSCTKAFRAVSFFFFFRRKVCLFPRENPLLFAGISVRCCRLLAKKVVRRVLFFDRIVFSTYRRRILSLRLVSRLGNLVFTCLCKRYFSVFLLILMPCLFVPFCFLCYKIVLYLCAEKNKTNERGFYQTSPLGTDSRRYRYFRSTDYIK